MSERPGQLVDMSWFDVVFSHSAVPSLIFDDDGLCRGVNGAMRSGIGRDEFDLIGEPCFDILVPENRVALAHFLTGAATPLSRGWTASFTITAPKGQKTSLRCAVTPVHSGRLDTTLFTLQALETPETCLHAPDSAKAPDGQARPESGTIRIDPASGAVTLDAHARSLCGLPQAPQGSMSVRQFARRSGIKGLRPTARDIKRLRVDPATPLSRVLTRERGGSADRFETVLSIDPKSSPGSQPPLQGVIRNVSATQAPRQDPHEILDEEEASYRMALDIKEALFASTDASNLGLFNHCPATGYTWWSSRWLSLLDYEEGDLEISSDTFLGLIHPDDAGIFEKAYIDLTDGRIDHYQIDFRMRAKSGDWRWIESCARRVDRSDKGLPYLICGTHADFSDRKETQFRLEEALRDARKMSERLDEIANSVPVGIFALSRPKRGLVRISYASDRMLELMGLNFSSVLTTAAFVSKVHVRDKRQLMRIFARSRKCRRPQQCNFRLVQDGGRVRWRQLSTQVRRERDGSTTWYGSVLDITDAVHRNEELEAARVESKGAWDRLNRITENMPGGIFEFSVSPEDAFSFGYVNTGFNAMLGLKPGEALADAAAAFRNVLPEDLEPSLASIFESRDALGHWNHRYRINHPELGVRWMMGSSTPRETGDGHVTFYGRLVDVTEEIEAKRALEQTRRRAEMEHERLNRLADNAPGALFQAQALPDGRTLMLYASSGQVDLMGLEAPVPRDQAELVFQNIDPDDMKLLDMANERSLRTLEPLDVSVRVNHPVRGQRWIKVSAHPVKQDDQSIMFYGYAFDTTEQHEREAALTALQEAAEAANSEIEHLALHDALTGLPNRRYFDRALAERAGLYETSGAAITLVRIDLDHFKYVNDTMGHEAGDLVLKVVGERVRSQLSEGSFTARLGGDEFVVLLPAGATIKQASALVRKIHRKLRQPILYNERPCRFGASFGVASTETVRNDPASLLSFADAALYRAKAQGRDRIEIFTSEFHADVLRNRRLADEIHAGLERNEFVPFFQPQVDAVTGALAGLEVLARWRHPERGILAPGEFLTVADQIRVTPQIDKTMFEMTLDCLTGWEAAGLRIPKVSFNLSSGRINDPDILNSIAPIRALETRVAFELLESIFLEEEKASFHFHIDAIKEAGVEIEIDDFGSGHASIVGLMHINPDTLKIDQRLVRPITDQPNARKLVSAIVEIGSALNIRITAEGVETEEHAKLLTALGCHTLQGYAFAKPMSAKDIVAFAAGDRLKSA